MIDVTLVDSTLRDGSHARAHQVTPEEAAEVAGGLDRARVPIIEVTHGDGLGGSSFNYGLALSDDVALISAAAGAAPGARIAVLLVPGIGVKDDLVAARDAGASVARVATHCTEADIAESHLGLARELGMTAVGFLMMAHMTPPERLAEQALIMAGAGAQVVYVTDSAGALVPDTVRPRVAALREALPDDVEVGAHMHQNLSLAVGNTLAAVEEGARWIDGCTCGLGAGAGNAPTEALVAACARSGIATGVDERTIADVAEEVVRPLMPQEMVVRRAELVLGSAGVYSSFLLHAERAAERFDVPVHDILMEVGRRKAVGGQEDLIIEVAAELAGSTAATVED